MSRQLFALTLPAMAASATTSPSPSVRSSSFPRPSILSARDRIALSLTASTWPRPACESSLRSPARGSEASNIARKGSARRYENHGGHENNHVQASRRQRPRRKVSSLHPRSIHKHQLVARPKERDRRMRCAQEDCDNVQQYRPIMANGSASAIMPPIVSERPKASRCGC